MRSMTGSSSTMQMRGGRLSSALVVKSDGPNAEVPSRTPWSIQGALAPPKVRYREPMIYQRRRGRYSHDKCAYDQSRAHSYQATRGGGDTGCVSCLPMARTGSSA